MDLLKAMRAFVGVIDAGSFAAASRALDLAPAIVTRLIAQLEQHVGARLINRTTRRLALTEIGTVYLERVRHILASIEEAEALIGSETREPSGMLRIAAPATLLSHQLTRLLPEFRARYPKLALSINALDKHVEMPDEGVDVTLLLAAGESLDGDFLARRLATAEIVFCAAPAYLDEHGRPEHPAELDEHELLVPNLPHVPRQVRFDRIGGTGTVSDAVQARVRRVRAINTFHHETLYSAALSGMGIMASPSFVVEEAVVKGSLERVLGGWACMSYTLYAAVPSRKFLPSRSRVFIDFLTEKFGGQPTDPWLALMAAEGAQRPRGVARRDTELVR